MSRKQLKLSLAFILMLNLTLACFLPLTSTNFTGLSQEKTLLVWIWTLGCSSLQLYNLYQISQKLKLNKNRFRFLFLLIQLSCLLSLLLPYQPETYPIFSGFHLLFAYLFFFGISGSFLYLLYQIQFLKLKQFNKIKNFYFLILFLCMLLFMNFLSINGLFEVVYTCGLAISIFSLSLAID